jgi:superfamily II DNA or RNA helicase
MSSSADVQQDPEFIFTSYQAKLVQDVLEAAVPVRHLLVAPVGTGKTTAAMSLVKEIVKASPNYRILIIGPRVTLEMYEQRLARAIPTANVTLLTRRTIRELEAAANESLPIWSSPVIVLLSMDTARQEDVLRHLRTVGWGLVILEEIQLFARSRWTLLKTIVADKTFQRVLLISGTSNLKTIASLLKNAARTEWGISDLQRDRLTLIAAPKFIKVEYRRGDDEVGLLKRVLSLRRELSPTSVGQLVEKTLLRQAASSPLALERTVRHLRNTLVHSASEILLTQGIESRIEQGNEALDTDADMALSGTRAGIPWKKKTTALATLQAVIEQLEAIETDKKREALEGLLQRLQQNAASTLRHIAVLCSSRATANYLHTVILERGTKAWLLTGESTLEEFNKTLDGFKNTGGVLISTLFALQGVDLRYVEALIHYDPPSSKAEIWARVSRSPTATNYLLVDTTRILPSEWNPNDLPASAS